MADFADRELEERTIELAGSHQQNINKLLTLFGKPLKTNGSNGTGYIPREKVIQIYREEKERLEGNARFDDHLIPVTLNVVRNRLSEEVRKYQ